MHYGQISHAKINIWPSRRTWVRSIEHLLKKFCFAKKWITWMMWCIKSVQYKILINGQSKARIISHRGLRQGYLLSPYLFILCTEVLVANIRKAEMEQKLSGLRIASPSPSTIHILFADDSLFFCKVNTEECQAILNILWHYKRMLEQQINFTKSSIQFEHK